MEKILKFINGVKKEIKRVRWPNKKNMFKYSLAVLFLSFIFALFFYSIDFIIAYFKVLLG